MSVFINGAVVALTQGPSGIFFSTFAGERPVGTYAVFDENQVMIPLTKQGTPDRPLTVGGSYTIWALVLVSDPADGTERLYFLELSDKATNLKQKIAQHTHRDLSKFWLYDASNNCNTLSAYPYKPVTIIDVRNDYFFFIDGALFCKVLELKHSLDTTIGPQSYQLLITEAAASQYELLQGTSDFSNVRFIESGFSTEAKNEAWKYFINHAQPGEFVDAAREDEAKPIASRNSGFRLDHDTVLEATVVKAALRSNTISTKCFLLSNTFVLNKMVMSENDHVFSAQVDYYKIDTTPITMLDPYNKNFVWQCTHLSL